MRRLVLSLVGAAAIGCNVSVLKSDDQGIGLDAVQHPAPCGIGLAVVSTDYASSVIGALGWDGTVLSPSLLSSGSYPPGLAQSLSGDVALPSAAASPTELVIIDRYPAGVLSFVDLATAQLRAQLDVSTGYRSNPHDYVAISRNKAYVTRFDPNPTPGRQPLDEGGDLLIVDPQRPEVTGRIALEPEPPTGTLLPHPDRALAVNGDVLVVVSRYSIDYRQSGVAHLVLVDPDTDRVLDDLLLDGLHGCSGLAVNPDQSEVAVVCSGKWRSPQGATVEESGVVRIGLDGRLKELGRLSAESLPNPQPFGFTVAYASSTRILTTVFGRASTTTTSAQPDRLLLWMLDLGEVRELSRTREVPFSFGDLLCSPQCDLCALGNAERGDVELWQGLAGQDPTPLRAMLEGSLGLPPRRLGVLARDSVVRAAVADP